MDMSKFGIILVLFLAYITVPINGNGQEKIQLTLEKSGIYTVPCEINGLRLRLIFDTGAKDVQLSMVEALFMLRNGYIDEDDFVGTGMYSTADGTISEHAIVNLRTIKIGSKVLTDVKACISSNIDAPMLLGQSALNKLGTYSISGSTLILGQVPDNAIYDMKGNLVPVNYTGKGTCRYKNNGVYSGDFVNGKMNGKGVVDFNEDGIFEGTFKDGNASHGTHTFKSGDKYVGQYKNGAWNGKGTYTWPNGDKYVGEFKNNASWGKGTYYYADGSKYIGDFVNDKREGEGTMTFPDGTKYVGHFKNDNFHGYGTYYWEDGSYYDSYWTDGHQDVGEEDRRWMYHKLKSAKKISITYDTFKKNLLNTEKRELYYDMAIDLGLNMGGYTEYLLYIIDGLGEQVTSTNTSSTDDNEFERNDFGTRDNEDYYLAQAKTELNLRSGPGTGFEILTKIPAGGYVVLTTGDSHQAFRKVLFTDKNIIGYVSRDYLTNFKKIEVDESGNLQVEGRNYKQNADVKIKNNTNKNITIVIGYQTYVFSPQETRTLYDITPKRYKIMASAPGVIPYVGFDTVEGGYEYSWTFYIKTERR